MMSKEASEAGTLVFERTMPHAPEKIWRALTEAPLIRQWLMANDFEPKVGHRFTFRAKPVPGWSGVTNCEVITVEPQRVLAYRWGDGTESDTELKTIVTWTLTPVPDGTLVTMEQSGFRPIDEDGAKAMSSGWPRILEHPEETVVAHVL